MLGVKLYINVATSHSPQVTSLYHLYHTLHYMSWDPLVLPSRPLYSYIYIVLYRNPVRGLDIMV